jgi:hypothetical protein
MGCILSVLANAACAEDFGQYTYLEQTGAVESSHTWIIQHSGKDVETRWIAPDKAYFNLCDASGNTQEWRVRYPDADIVAKRVGNLIRLQGTRNGKVIHQDLEIDASPWFQPLSYALGRFSQSHLDSVVFWTIRPDTLTVVKLRARSLGEEQVTTRAGLFPARKVRISLDGFLSHFWEAHYWFRQADGLFVRYEGANGLPGTPITTIQLGG